MLVLLVILFKTKLHARINIFNVIKKKYGQETLEIASNLEEVITKHRKIKLHIDFIVKRKGLIPTSVPIKLAIRHGTKRFSRNINTTKNEKSNRTC